MESLKPIKIERTEKPSESLQPKPQDTKEARRNYDPRLYDESKLAEEYRHYPLMKFFDMYGEDRDDKRGNEQLKEVNMWLDRQYESYLSVTDRFMELRRLERRIGMPQMGDTRLNHMYTYVLLDNQINKLNAQKREQYGM